jgi:hypothetical protein
MFILAACGHFTKHALDLYEELQKLFRADLEALNRLHDQTIGNEGMARPQPRVNLWNHEQMSDQPADENDPPGDHQFLRGAEPKIIKQNNISKINQNIRALTFSLKPNITPKGLPFFCFLHHFLSK